MSRPKSPKKKRVAPAASGRLAAYRPTLDRLLFIVALLGILVTVHLRIQEGRGFDQGCWGFNPDDAASAAVFDCQAVTSSTAGKLFGLPNSILGMLFYFTVAALSVAVLFVQQPRQALVRRLRGGLAAAGFLFSMYLVYVQTTQIGEYCALCLTSASLATLLFLLVLYDYFTSPAVAPMKASSSLAKETRLYAGLAVLTLMLVGADALYFASLDPYEPAPTVAVADEATPPPSAPSTTPAQPVIQNCALDSRYAPVPDYLDLIDYTDPMKGDASSPVTVIEFLDPNCGHCGNLNPIMKRVVERYEDRVAFYFKPFELNPQMPLRLAQTQALHAANEEGKFFEMLDGQFANQHRSRGQGLPLDDLKQIAANIGMNGDALVRKISGNAYRGKVLRDRQLGSSIANLQGVPMVLVNGLPIGTKTEACLNQYIDEALANAGN